VHRHIRGKIFVIRPVLLRKLLTDRQTDKQTNAGHYNKVIDGCKKMTISATVRATSMPSAVTADCVWTALFLCDGVHWPASKGVWIGRLWKAVIWHLIVYWEILHSHSLAVDWPLWADDLPNWPRLSIHQLAYRYCKPPCCGIKCLITSTVRASTGPTSQRERKPTRTWASHMLSTIHGEHFRPVAIATHSAVCIFDSHTSVLTQYPLKHRDVVFSSWFLHLRKEKFESVV